MLRQPRQQDRSRGAEGGGGGGEGTKSVMAAPLARMALKAAWPGVSRKVRDCWLSGIFTSKAPMCCTPATHTVSLPPTHNCILHCTTPTKLYAAVRLLMKASLDCCQVPSVTEPETRHLKHLISHVRGCMCRGEGVGRGRVGGMLPV